MQPTYWTARLLIPDYTGSKGEAVGAFSLAQGAVGIGLLRA